MRNVDGCLRRVRELLGGGGFGGIAMNFAPDEGDPDEAEANDGGDEPEHGDTSFLFSPK